MVETVRGNRALATILAFVALIGAVYFVAQNMVLNGFDSVDQDAGRETALRMRFALRAQALQLESLGRNWADWTDAYDYVSAKTPQARQSFRDEELSDESLVGLDCDLFAYLTTSGDKIFAVTIDHRTKRVQEARSSFIEALRENGLSTRMNSHPSLLASIRVEGEPLLVSIQRVHRSGKPSEWNGAIVSACWVKAGVKKSLNEQLRLPVQVSSADSLALSSSHRASPKTKAIAVTNADARQSILLNDEDDDEIEVKTLFSDLKNRPVMWVTTRVPRLARQQGQISIHSFLVALLGLGTLSLLVTLTLQKALARKDVALRQETESFELVTRHLPDPLFVRDLNEQKTRVYGQVASGVATETDWLDESLAEEERQQRAIWLRELSESGVRAEREWKIGDATWLELVTPVRTGGEECPVSHLVGTAIDISSRKRAEREKDVLLKEIHHRVKNNLQIVVSLLNLQADTMLDAEARAGFMEARARVRSMALIHEQLYRQTDLSHVDFGTYLESLLQLLLRSYRHTAVQLKSDIEAVPLDIDIAVPCGLIVTELVGNAFKHAFVAVPAGSANRGEEYEHELCVRLRAEPHHRVLLQIEDNGPGLPADFCLEESESLGLQIVDSLATQLGATIEVGDRDGERGTRWTLCFEALESSHKRIQGAQQ